MEGLLIESPANPFPVTPSPQLAAPNAPISLITPERGSEGGRSWETALFPFPTRLVLIKVRIGQDCGVISRSAGNDGMDERKRGVFNHFRCQTLPSLLIYHNCDWLLNSAFVVACSRRLQSIDKDFQNRKAIKSCNNAVEMNCPLTSGCSQRDTMFYPQAPANRLA